MTTNTAVVSRLTSPLDSTTTNNLLSLLKQQMVVIEQVSQASDQARLEAEDLRIQLDHVKEELEAAQLQATRLKDEADQAKYVATEAKAHAEKAISIAKDAEIQTKQARMEAMVAIQQAEQAKQEALEARAESETATLHASQAELRAEEEASKVESLMQEIQSLHVSSELSKKEAKDARDFAQRVVKEAQKKQCGGEATVSEELRRLKRLLEKSREEVIKAKKDARSVKDALEFDRKLAKEEIERVKVDAEMQMQGAKEDRENAKKEASKAKEEAEALRAEADKLRSELLRVQAQPKAESIRSQAPSKGDFEATLLKAKKEIKRARAEAERAYHEAEKARADAECARVEAAKMISDAKRALAEKDTRGRQSESNEARECPESVKDAESVEGLVSSYKSLKKQIDQRIWQQIKAEKQTSGPFPHLVDYRLSRYSEISKEWGLS